MKRMLDKNDKSTGSKNESSFKGDSIKIYNFFLNSKLFKNPFDEWSYDF